MPAQFVFVDDKPETIETELRAKLGGENLEVVRFKEDFENGEIVNTKRKLDASSVVLMDFELYENGRPKGFNLQPADGIALERIVRDWLQDANEPFDTSNKAFVLFSHDLGSLKTVVSGREHVVARKTANEWIISKNEKDRPQSQKDLRVLLELAKAVEALPKKAIEPEQLRTTVKEIFAIAEQKDANWKDIALDDCEKFGFPLDALLAGNSMAVIRWLLHVALPFPGALVDIDDTAALLRLIPEQLKPEAIDALAKSLVEFKYQGVLSTFMGDRWWRAGIDCLRLKLSAQSSEGRKAVWDALRTQCKVPLADSELCKMNEPVLVVDPEMRKTRSLEEMGQCVRLLNDDWPAKLDPPWIKISEAMASPRLAALVHPDDQYKLQ
jgi:hypothetical protein